MTPGVLWILDGKFHREAGTGEPVLLSSPRPEIDQLASFRTEGPPAIAFPGGLLPAKRAEHEPILPSTEERGRGELAGADLVCRPGLQ